MKSQDKVVRKEHGWGVHEPYAELFLQSMYLYELLSSSPNSAQDGPVSCSAPNISVSVVVVRTTGFSNLSFSALGNATGFMVKPSWKDGTVDGMSQCHWCKVIFSFHAV